MANTLPNVSPGSPNDVQVSTLNQVIDLINAYKRTQTLNDGTTDRYLFGFQQTPGWPAGKEGIKISATGSDVNTANFNDLLFAQDFATGTMYFNKGGVNYAQIGTSDGAIKIAGPGVNVSDASNSQLVFNSNKSFTVLLQGSYTFTSFINVPNGTIAKSSVITIAHNAGFVPAVNCFAPATVGGYVITTAPTGFPTADVTLVDGSWVIQQSDTEFFQFYHAIDSTNLYLGINFANNSGGTLSSQPVTVYYTVFTLNATTG